MGSNFKHTAESIRRDIESIVNKVGLLCRVFARGKDVRSLNEKMSREVGKYSKQGKLIQDAIGVRVVLYFEEDVDIVAKLLSSEFVMDVNASTVDTHANDQFKVTRHNLIFKLPDQYVYDMQRASNVMPIDTTFEVQLRSILSEGWHEVDHDLRYKSKSSWIGQDDLSRALNGILATIETADWSMRRIFDDLAYRHYKNRNWETMLHNKIRMRVAPKLSEEIVNLINTEINFAKDIYQINRTKVIHRIAKAKPCIPLSLDNIVYVWNYIGPKNTAALSITPQIILDSLIESDQPKFAQ
jgi:ppGpp synthetase/RelA/SpoT-type nucleotidyltranferase